LTVDDGPVLRELARNVEAETVIAVPLVDPDGLRPCKGGTHEEPLRETPRHVRLPRIVAIGRHRDEELPVGIHAEFREERAAVLTGARNQTGIGFEVGQGLPDGACAGVTGGDDKPADQVALQSEVE